MRYRAQARVSAGRCPYHRQLPRCSGCFQGCLDAEEVVEGYSVIRTGVKDSCCENEMFLQAVAVAAEMMASSRAEEQMWCTRACSIQCLAPNLSDDAGLDAPYRRKSPAALQDVMAAGHSIRALSTSADREELARGRERSGAEDVAAAAAAVAGDAECVGEKAVVALVGAFGVVAAAVVQVGVGSCHPSWGCPQQHRTGRSEMLMLDSEAPIRRTHAYSVTET